MNTMSHACGGTILVGGSGEQVHHYCDRCRAFAYGDDEVPAGSDERANREAWDAGEEQSPDPGDCSDDTASETAGV